MTRLARLAIAVAGITALGLIAYELVREALEPEEKLPEGASTYYPEERPPYAEAAESASD
jgi:hypothetical protein